MGKYPEPQFDFKADLAIDKHRLDEELVGQAQRMIRYSVAHAQAQLDRDRAKQALDITKANLDSSIRSELAAAGVKFTEAVVDGKIRTAPTYIEAQTKLQEAEYRVNVMFGGVMAMNARRPMLEELVRLFTSSYWADPRPKAGQESRPEAASERAIMQGPLPEDIYSGMARVGAETAMGSAKPPAAPMLRKAPTPKRKEG